ncbi:hypothetical protein DFAR_3000024 [Desulfarculales bacterium]
MDLHQAPRMVENRRAIALIREVVDPHRGTDQRWIAPPRPARGAPTPARG